MQRYKYRAVNAKGRSVRGVISAINEVDLHNQLLNGGLELIEGKPVDRKKMNLSIGKKKIKIRDLIQLFMHLEQMQSAGVPLLDALSDIRDTTEHDALRDIMSEIHKEVSEGSSLSEAMGNHPKVFNNLYISLVSSGEETGDLTSSYLQLVKYLKWVDQMQSKVRKATRYPMIVSAVVLLTLTVMMTVVVPEVAGFIKNIGQALPFYTIWLINTSEFFQKYWWAVLLAPFIILIFVKLLRKSSDEMAYKIDAFKLRVPVMGPLIRKISIARFAQTFGALFASGIDVLNGLESARRTVSNLALGEALEDIQEKVHAGAPLSEAFNASGEFPSMVVRMLKVGEESGNLTVVLEQVSDFYTSDVDEAIQGLITMIEPSLTAIMGGMILWIAAAVFGPIYSSFEHLNM